MVHTFLAGMEALVPTNRAVETAVPVNKVSAITLGCAVATIFTFIIGTYWQPLPNGMEEAVTTVFVTLGTFLFGAADGSVKIALRR